ncbi:hypothetical protein C3E79_03845 [Corynebacterium liangguodongii]|uniref:Uncharacterized protein n=1 Tax=Corynebacterium liangguodongii TaxID=2079535 RepID=A0A2S0WD77_9CORY|nr:hypothetical protein C3E79_03845 [Corynebacterium liangguodongii]PWB99465.1 hypothetical protein DF219_05950 [Corynebacterium liangguodongii]
MTCILQGVLMKLRFPSAVLCVATLPACTQTAQVFSTPTQPPSMTERQSKVAIRSATSQPAEDNFYDGTVVNRSTAEVLDGRASPNNESPDNEYIVLVFDSPRGLTAPRLT